MSWRSSPATAPCGGSSSPTQRSTAASGRRGSPCSSTPTRAAASPRAGVVAAAMLVPAALLAPVVAAIGERYPPGKALVAGYVAQAVSCGAVAAALRRRRARRSSSTPLLVGPAVAFTMTRPTQAAFAPGLARTPRELAATNVVSGWVESVSVLVAPIFAGVVLAVGSPWLVFALMGAGCARRRAARGSAAQPRCRRRRRIRTRRAPRSAAGWRCSGATPRPARSSCSSARRASRSARSTCSTSSWRGASSTSAAPGRATSAARPAQAVCWPWW